MKIRLIRVICVLVTPRAIKKKETMQTNKNALKIVNTLRKNGYQALYAGGCVRDFLLKLDSKDIDIATDAKPEVVMSLFKKTIPVGAQFGVIIALMGDEQYEVATFRSDVGYKDGRHPEKVVFTDARQDAERRDFTINGMFYDPIKKEILDYVGGQADLEAKIIRAIGDPELRFKEDKLRMLRAVRFSARFKYPIEENTKNAIIKNSHKITEVSFERIHDELIKIFTGQNRGSGLQLLHDLGLLSHILPEIEAMIGVEQPPEFHPEGDVFKHTKLTMDLLGDNPSPVLAFAGLLHDVGKPLTFKIMDRIRFHGHDTIGAKLADKILKRLKFSNEDRKRIILYIIEHMRFMHVQEMRVGKLKKMLQRDSIIEEIKLHEADCLASHGNIENKKFCLEKLKEFSVEELKPEPLVTGDDLIKAGYKPGPLFKEILADVENQQLEGEINNKDKALGYILAKYKK